MKRFFSILMVACAMTTIVACGDKNSGTDNSGDGDKGGSVNTSAKRDYSVIETITNDNYVGIVENLGNITYKTPSGWEIRSIEKQKGASVYDASIRLHFKQPVSDVETYASDLITECAKSTNEVKDVLAKKNKVLGDMWLSYDYTLSSHKNEAGYSWSYLVPSSDGFEEISVSVYEDGETLFTFKDWDKYK